MNANKSVYPLAVVVGLAILMSAFLARGTAPTIPDFRQFPEGKERKSVFFNYFRPLIEEHNQSIRALRRQLRVWYENRENLSWFARSRVEKLAINYGLKKFDLDNEKHWQSLLMRVDIVPTSLALAQAAMESAWGTSRFALEVNNYFGQWCFSKACGLVPTEREPGAKHEVKGFDSPEHSVASYVHNLNTHRAYRSFRMIRARLREEEKVLTGVALAGGLNHYSERGEVYVKEVRAFMKQNRLSRYDQKTTGQ
ncbi:glucosaminidase domain-containing protein [Kaarinaea lacus]